jgi:diguanylate cyclase (GGDEF)-like protein
LKIDTALEDEETRRGMPMISFKKFRSQDDEARDACLEAIRVLVRGIEESADPDLPVAAAFRESMEEIQEALDLEITPEALVTHAAKAVAALKNQNAVAGRRLRLHVMELQNMLSMLAAAVRAASAAGENNLSRLTEIDRQAVTVSDLNELRVIKLRLADCLKDIRVESERQRKETQDALAHLTRGLEQARQRIAPLEAAATPDPLTGLAPRAEAESALAKAGLAREPAYAAIFVLDRLQTLNMRFGRETGDEVLAYFVETMRERLSPSDRLFRWAGPALVAMLPRTESIDRVRSEIAQMMENQMQHTVQMQLRPVSIPITTRWTVFPLLAAARLLYQKLDAFAAAQAAAR